MKRFLSYLLGLLLLFGMVPSLASAHANLLAATPDNGQVVNKSPDTVTLTFSEILDLDAVNLQIYDAKGNPVRLTGPQLTPGNAKQMYAKLPALQEGTYTVNWQVISVDGHPVAGSYSFSVGKQTPVTSPPVDQPSPDGANGSLIPLRYLVESLLLIGSGLCWIAWLAGKRGFPVFAEVVSRRWRLIAWCLLLAGCIAEWFVYTAFLPDSVFNSIAGGNWEVLKQIPFAGMLWVQFFLLLLLAIPRMREGRYLLLWTLLTASFAFGGHAWAIEPTWFDLAIRMLHLIALSLWLGGLTYLVLVLRWEKRNNRETNRAMLRPFFVRMAMMGAVLTLASGVVMVSIQTDWSVLIEKAALWSNLLAIKIGLFLVMLLLALRQTLSWRKDGRSLSPTLLRWEWVAGALALLAGVWMSQSAFPLP